MTYADNAGCVFVQEDDFAVRIETVDAPSLVPGDVVVAAGFVDTAEHVAGLTGAVVRVIGKQAIPPPLAIRFSEILEDSQKLQSAFITQVPGYDGIYAELSGRVLRHTFETDRARNLIELDCGDSVSTIFVMGNAKPHAPGSRIRARGVVKFDYERPPHAAYYLTPSKLDLLVSGNTMIEVLSSPPWWTVERALIALILAACLVLAALAWAFSLRRALRSKVQQLAVEMNHRRNAALEFQAALRERTRLAANLHDTLLQTVSGIGYQLEACARQIPKSDHAVGSLETAKRMVRRGQADLRGAVWTLRALPQHNGSFEDSVRSVVQQALAGHECEVKIEVDPQIDHLADFVGGNVLLVIQEAVINALRHACPKSIVVEARSVRHPNGISVSIRDDGSGFRLGSHASVSQGHFGLQGMNERIERLSGHFEIDSQPGKGTVVKFVVPVREFDELLEDL